MRLVRRRFVDLELKQFWMAGAKNFWMVEPQPEIWVPDPQRYFMGQTSYTMFLLIFWTTLLRTRNQKLLDVRTGDKNLDARSRSLIFEFRIHSLGAQRTYWRYHCSMTYVAQQWRSYHHLLLRNQRHRATVMPARIKVNWNFREARLERFYSVSINRVTSLRNDHKNNIIGPCDSPVTTYLNFRRFTETFS